MNVAFCNKVYMLSCTSRINSHYGVHMQHFCLFPEDCVPAVLHVHIDILEACQVGQEQFNAIFQACHSNWRRTFKFPSCFSFLLVSSGYLKESAVHCKVQWKHLQFQSALRSSCSSVASDIIACWDYVEGVQRQGKNSLFFSCCLQSVMSFSRL